ncbi:hypothetical protein BKA70DRAFT_1234936 [Coprinopsis sp. MPI-PUGE-AT-0042]|nr:hypothetical protein BKA70DRAFT_1234936 [Coprinopsis sp. MPI-PUGE-AT-0042]
MGYANVVQDASKEEQEAVHDAMKDKGATYVEMEGEKPWIGNLASTTLSDPLQLLLLQPSPSTSSLGATPAPLLTAVNVALVRITNTFEGSRVGPYRLFKSGPGLQLQDFHMLFLKGGKDSSQGILLHRIAAQDHESVRDGRRNSLSSAGSVKRDDFADQGERVFDEELQDSSIEPGPFEVNATPNYLNQINLPPWGHPRCGPLWAFFSQRSGSWFLVSWEVKYDLRRKQICEDLYARLGELAQIKGHPGTCVVLFSLFFGTFPRHDSFPRPALRIRFCTFKPTLLILCALLMGARV